MTQRVLHQEGRRRGIVSRNEGILHYLLLYTILLLYCYSYIYHYYCRHLVRVLVLPPSSDTTYVHTYIPGWYGIVIAHCHIVVS